MDSNEQSQGKLAEVRRRIYLTYRYHGPGAVLGRVLTFPLRFTPLRRWVDPRARRDLHRRKVMSWYRRHGRPVTVVIASYRDADRVAALVGSIRRTTRHGRVRIVVADDASGPEHLARLAQIKGIEVIAGEHNQGFAANINRGLRAAGPGEDVVVLNSDMIARPGWLAALQYAASRHPNVGVFTGKLLYEDERIQFAGTVRNLGAPEWFDHRYRFKPANFPPSNITLPVLAATGACMYISRAALEQVGLMDERFPMAYEDVDFSLRMWKAGYAVLYVPDAEFVHLESITRGTEVGERERASQRVFWRRWGEFFDARPVRTPEGALKVIYVTQDTGVGGGHRVVFEHLNGLYERGHDVELWTLTGPPDWFDLKVPTRTFRDYPALIRALEPIDAIKVATWWETAPPVWHASVLRGIPVYFVQDIETSYYPDSQLAQAQVLASYRHEFRYMTTSGWNLDRLRELGLEAAQVPPGIDLSSFRRLEEIAGPRSGILAIGRSNPLKNLPLTLEAWRGLQEPRPALRLFGIEPEVAPEDPSIEYIIGPSDGQVNRLLNEALAFVQTSSHEGFCLPVLEAMAAGCPVVCTDAHGNRDYCEDGLNCLMPHADQRSVTAALSRVLGDPELRERLTRAGIETAAAYSWPRRIDALEEFLEQIAQPRQIVPSTAAVPQARKRPA